MRDLARGVCTEGSHALLKGARDELPQELNRAPNISDLAEHLHIDRQWVIEATIAGSNYSTLSTDKQQQADEEFKCLGDTLGQDDSGLEKVGLFVRGAGRSVMPAARVIVTDLSQVGSDSAAA